jgi:hypothetical protein
MIAAQTGFILFRYEGGFIKKSAFGFNARTLLHDFPGLSHGFDLVANGHRHLG